MWRATHPSITRAHADGYSRADQLFPWGVPCKSDGQYSWMSASVVLFIHRRKDGVLETAHGYLIRVPSGDLTFLSVHQTSKQPTSTFIVSLLHRLPSQQSLKTIYQHSNIIQQSNPPIIMAVHGQTNWTEIEDEQYQNCRYPISLAGTQVNTTPRFTRSNTNTVSPACLEFARFAVYPQGQNRQFNSPTLSPPLTPCVGGGNFMPFDGMQEHSRSYFNSTVQNNYVVESAHFALSPHHNLPQYYPLSPPESCDNVSISLGYSDQGSPIFSEPTSPESRITEAAEGRDMEDTFEDEDEPLYPRRRRACSEDGDYEMGDSHGQRRKTPLSVRQYSNEKYDSYAVIIYHALMSVPERKMILADIYDYYRKAQPERALKDDGWKNSIRHNLSMNGVSTNNSYFVT
jgi:hypothetical protein